MYFFSYFILFFVILSLQKTSVSQSKVVNLKKIFALSLNFLDVFTLRFFQFFFRAYYNNIGFLANYPVHYVLNNMQFLAVLNNNFYLNNAIFFFNYKQCKDFFRVLYLFFITKFFGYCYDFSVRGKGYKFKFFKKLGKSFLVFKYGGSHRIFFLVPNMDFLTYGANRRFDFFFLVVINSLYLELFLNCGFKVFQMFIRLKAYVIILRL